MNDRALGHAHCLSALSDAMTRPRLILRKIPVAKMEASQCIHIAGSIVFSETLMQSFGLALTLSVLTGTFVALDLSDWQAEPSRQSSSLYLHHDARPEHGADPLSIMPSGLPGIVVPKADINHGVFSIGSSTGKEGLENDTSEVDGRPDGHDGAGDDDDETAAPNKEAEKMNDFVLV
jgi:hypothetical protein